MIVDPALLEEVNGARGKSARHGQAQRGGRPRTGAFESIDTTREKLGQPSDLQLLQKTFDRMK